MKNDSEKTRNDLVLSELRVTLDKQFDPGLMLGLVGSNGH